ncbi:hypothetical protein JHK85_010679 [Glycine max]|uniref:Uncharacterized protein n=1 Tax=Glycine max TaxID=3847 RepID=K7KKG3_SOYBN|nr:hypothetical protein JHK85_010679 [Glycine max]KAH1111617.1 hypothetical protein GYH30_010125 [Glycine max]
MKPYNTLYDNTDSHKQCRWRERVTQHNTLLQWTQMRRDEQWLKAPKMKLVQMCLSQWKERQRDKRKLKRVIFFFFGGIMRN